MAFRLYSASNITSGSVQIVVNFPGVTLEDAPNTFTPGQWARVVSAVTWAEYALSEAGTVQAKTLRGPLIVWATAGGEGKSKPQTAATPTPSPLSVEVARLNTRPHVLAFVRAAHGKVRLSVRWRTSRRRQWRQFARLNILVPMGECSAEYAHVNNLINRRHLSKFGARRVKSLRKSLITELSVDDRLGQLKDFVLTFESLGEPVADNPAILALAWACDVLKKGAESPKDHVLPGVLPPSDVGLYAAITGDKEALRAYMLFRSLNRLTLGAVIARLCAQGDIYRAHLARRVKSVSRPARVRRPLYARPRPPTAPLAPPVA